MRIKVARQQQGKAILDILNSQRDELKPKDTQKQHSTILQTNDESTKIRPAMTFIEMKKEPVLLVYKPTDSVSNAGSMWNLQYQQYSVENKYTILISMNLGLVYYHTYAHVCRYYLAKKDQCLREGFKWAMIILDWV